VQEVVPLQPTGPFDGKIRKIDKQPTSISFNIFKQRKMMMDRIDSELPAHNLHLEAGASSTHMIKSTTH
jgi:hypothetical protein